MKRLIAACIILAASAFIFTSCGSKSNDSDDDEDDIPRSKKKEHVEKEASSKKLSVGFSQVGAESDWRRASTKSIQDAAAQRPQIDLTFADAMQKQENQIKAIRTFIRKKVDVISFSPVVSSGFEDVLKEAKKAGIPVVLAGRAVDADPGLYTCLIGSDFVEEGRRPVTPISAGRWSASSTWRTASSFWSMRSRAACRRRGSC